MMRMMVRIIMGMIVVVMMLMMVTGLSYQTGTEVWLVCCWFSWMPWHHSRLYSLWFIQPTVLRSGSHLYFEYLCFIAIFGKPTMHLIYIGKFLVSCSICIPSVCDIRQLGEGYNHTATLPHFHTSTLWKVTTTFIPRAFHQNHVHHYYPQHTGTKRGEK